VRREAAAATGTVAKSGRVKPRKVLV
jgi:hypothetical protein